MLKLLNNLHILIWARKDWICYFQSSRLPDLFTIASKWFYCWLLYFYIQLFLFVWKAKNKATSRMKKYQKYAFVRVIDCKELGNEPRIMCVNHLLFGCSHFHFYYTENMRLLYHGNKGIISQLHMPKQHNTMSCPLLLDDTHANFGSRNGS